MDEIRTEFIENCINAQCGCILDKDIISAKNELTELKKHIAELEQQLRDAEERGYNLAASRMYKYGDCDEPKCMYMTYAEARAAQELRIKANEHQRT